MKGWIRLFSPAAWAALVALVLIAAYDVVVPQPGAVQTQRKPVSKLEKEGVDMRAKLASLRADLGEMTWKGAEDEIAPKAMEEVSRIARKCYVDVSAFRPQRTTTVDGVIQLNYLLAAQAPFPDIVKFLKSFESKGSRMAVKAFQISSADGASDEVRASVTLVAYRTEVTDGK